MSLEVASASDPSPLGPVDHGALPAWKTADLPEPLPFTFRNALKTIGPGAILLAGSIGGGEWIAGPMMTVQYGRGILWIATVAIVLQMIFNLEAVRYTLYTGEPIVSGIMRLRPGARVWSLFYIVIGIAQLATPALALGSANVLLAAARGRLPDSAGADSSTLLWIAYGVMLVSVILLLSGRSIERVLEWLSWGMIALIFAFLLVVNVLFVPAAAWGQTAAAFVTPTSLPENVDIMLLALFAATAGSGGLGNLAISNWFRDKGFGMGAYMGGIGGAFAKDHVELSRVGYVFPTTPENLGRWRNWWKYALADQAALWASGCAIGMFLNVNLAAALIPADAQISDYAVGAFQARYMADQLWQGFWVLTLINGFWILYSTHLGNTDCLTRTVADICWAGYPRLQRWSASRLYAVLLLLFTAWGAVTLYLGESALSLFKILGVIASPIMAIAAIQILRVNTRFLPPEIRPSWWRRAALVACSAGYGAIAAALLISFFQPKPVQAEPKPAASAANPAPALADSRSFPATATEDIHGVEHRPSGHAPVKATVMVFIMHDCPIANAYLPELNRIHEAFAPRGVQLWLIHADPALTLAAARQHAREYQIRPPVFLDPQHRWVFRAGATKTPEAVVFSPKGELLYRGRIDDRYVGLGKRRTQATSHDLRVALEAVLAGRPAPPGGAAVGCLIPPLSEP